MRGTLFYCNLTLDNFVASRLARSIEQKRTGLPKEPIADTDIMTCLIRFNRKLRILRRKARYSMVM